MKGPVLINFSGKRALVVGAGKIGARRAQTLAGYGCFVTCIAPEPLSECLGALKVKWLKGNYEHRFLEGMDLVVAATNCYATNGQILLDCRKRRIWCNAVDHPDESDFIFPSVVQRGDLTLSVCTDGASPFLGTQIKKELEEKYDESYIERTALLKKLRQGTLVLEITEKEKRERLREMAQWSLDKLREEVEKV
ncbi:MAG: bifunctional precorrin-2 dehydrogenase/sirohydrochlorin ferrochelatase [Eubacterium sp.]